MGYQLWISPITGYRRRGTRLSDFHAALSRKITALELYEPLRSIALDTPALEALELLDARDFDVAGVKETAEGPVIGFVRRAALARGTMIDAVDTLRNSEIVEVSVDIEELLRKLSVNGFVFVTIEQSVRGILTTADLNKPIVRSYLFGLISLFEIHLSYWIKTYYKENDWKEKLSRKRALSVQQTQQEMLRRGQSIALVDCLQFADKREIILRTKDLVGILKLTSRKAAEPWLKQAEMLRNALAHSYYDLLSGTSWPDLIALVALIEGLVAVSDSELEKEYRTMDVSEVSGYW